MVPHTALDGLTNGIQWTYIDLEAQFAALSMHHDVSGPDLDEPVANATLALEGTSPVLTWGLDEELTAAIGFHPLGVNQVLYVGDPGFQVQYFAAPFDADALFAAWSSSGYERVEPVAGTDLWTIGPDGEFDFEHPIQNRLISTMNNLALIDEVIVATPTLASLQAVVEFIRSDGTSLLDEPGTGALVASLPNTIASAIAFQPAVLALPPIDLDDETLQVAERAAIRAEVGPMPPLQGAIAAVEAGAYLIESDWSESGTREETVRPDAGTVCLRLATSSPEDAAQALTVIEQRWEKLNSLMLQVPYAEIMEIIEGSTNGDVVELTFRQLRQPQAWRQMVQSRDLLPLAPDEQ
jgi:hypothetical protein